MNKIIQNSFVYIVVFCITYFIYVYPFETLSNLLFNKITSMRASLYYTVIISALVIFYFRSSENFKPLRYFVYEGMGIGFISFWVVTIANLISFLIPMYASFLGFISLFIIFILSIISIYYGNKVFSKEINIQSNKIDSKKSFIFISDIHLGSNSPQHLKKIINLINEYKFDFILIGGDLIDSSKIDISVLRLFNSFNSPIFYVTGNHEYYIKNSNQFLNNLKLFNIQHVSNKSLPIDYINLIGINDNLTPQSQIEYVMKNIDNNKYNLLLIHKPSIWTKINKNIDLMLSGHTHNGQIFPFNLFVRIKFKFKYGLFTHDKSHLYVSSGAASWGPKMRLGTFNEIILFHLLPN